MPLIRQELAAKLAASGDGSYDPVGACQVAGDANGGTGSDPVWELDVDDLGSDLNFNQDTATHGLIEPASPMAFAEYERALETTRAKWTRHIG